MSSGRILRFESPVGTVESLGSIQNTLCGIERRFLADSGAGYGTHDELGIDTFWLTKPIDARPATVGNGTNVAFLAPSRETVRNFHHRGLELGGTSEGEPGVREEAHPNFHAAYLRDLDGNKIVAVCHESEG